jgi:hypothetical protein
LVEKGGHLENMCACLPCNCSRKLKAVSFLLRLSSVRQASRVLRGDRSRPRFRSSR